MVSFDSQYIEKNFLLFGEGVPKKKNAMNLDSDYYYLLIS